MIWRAHGLSITPEMVDTGSVHMWKCVYATRMKCNICLCSFITHRPQIMKRVQSVHVIYVAPEAFNWRTDSIILLNSCDFCGKINNKLHHWQMVPIRLHKIHENALVTLSRVHKRKNGVFEAYFAHTCFNFSDTYVHSVAALYQLRCIAVHVCG